jgi:hypothetical protein
MVWEIGRQHSGYVKYLIFESQRLKLDVYLLKFVEGSKITPHIDEVIEGKHYRLNIYLRNAREGGEFSVSQHIFRNRFMCLFRPDKFIHSVSEVKSGTRYVLSIGKLL